MVLNSTWLNIVAAYVKTEQDDLENYGFQSGCLIITQIRNYIFGLFHLKNGKIVKMISGYDEFTEKAYPFYEGGTKKEREIRDLLINTMKKYNFEVYQYEWWHFNYNDCNSKILNYSFEELDSLLF